MTAEWKQPKQAKLQAARQSGGPVLQTQATVGWEQQWQAELEAALLSGGLAQATADWEQQLHARSTAACDQQLPAHRKPRTAVATLRESRQPSASSVVDEAQLVSHGASRDCERLYVMSVCSGVPVAAAPGGEDTALKNAWTEKNWS